MKLHFFVAISGPCPILIDLGEFRPYLKNLFSRESFSTPWANRTEYFGFWRLVV